MTRAPSVSPSRRSVLDSLKQSGEAAAEEVAGDLAITPAAARQHLAALEGEELVACRDEPRSPGARGRPRKLYSVTTKAEPLFPKAYGALTNELLGYAEEEDDGFAQRLFERRRDSRIANATARLAGEATLRRRVAELSRILDEDGYLAEWEEMHDGTFRIVEHNCAILAVAEHHPRACRSEIEFLQAALPDTTVERVSHIVAGARQCAYVVRPKARRRRSRVRRPGG